MIRCRIATESGALGHRCGKCDKGWLCAEKSPSWEAEIKSTSSGWNPCRDKLRQARFDRDDCSAASRPCHVQILDMTCSKCRPAATTRSSWVPSRAPSPWTYSSTPGARGGRRARLRSGGSPDVTGDTPSTSRQATRGSAGPGGRAWWTRGLRDDRLSGWRAVPRPALLDRGGRPRAVVPGRVNGLLPGANHRARGVRAPRATPASALGAAPRAASR